MIEKICKIWYYLGMENFEFLIYEQLTAAITANRGILLNHKI